MTTACESFFTLPELVAVLVPFLSKGALIRLATTNRILNTICIPLFWHSIDFKDNTLVTRLLSSSPGLTSFSRNASSIRFINWKPNFSWFYFHALWTYFITSPRPEHNLIPLDALSQSSWGNLPHSPVPFLEPLPPLTQLSRFTASLRAYPADKFPPGIPIYNHDNHAHQTMWLLRLNSVTMTYLDITQVDMKASSVVRDLCRTISHLSHLKTLRLESQPGRAFTPRGLEMLFFSCPVSLVELLLDFRILRASRFESLDAGVDDWDHKQGTLPLREVPLRHLKAFGVPAMPDQYLTRFFCATLGHLPALEVLRLPYLEQMTDDMKSVLALMGEKCPRISELSFPDDCPTKHAMSFLERVVPAAQQLKSFSCSGNHDQNPGPMIAAWTRHSTTLSRIELSQVTFVESKVIHAALTTCTALEILKVTGRGTPGDICLKFEHAVEGEWVCKMLRELDITVRATPDGKDSKFMTDQSKHSWTIDNHRQWEDLGKFYSQVGALTQLEILDLKAVREDGKRVYEASETCFPGLLALENPSHGKIGYLSTLSELTKLRELRGSFRWIRRKGDANVRIGEREVDWFVDHLPGLKVAAFGSKRIYRNEKGWHPVQEFLNLLEKRRPGLRIYVE